MNITIKSPRTPAAIKIESWKSFGILDGSSKTSYHMEIYKSK